MTLASAPFVGHVCPNADDLRPGVDDLCDLPEPWHRLAYALSIDSQHDCSDGFGHHSDFCKHAVWREVVAERRVATSQDSPLFAAKLSADGNDHSEAADDSS